MKNVIKGQVAMLVALLTAFAVTLSACGGGSSSAGGGSAVRMASVSGTVTNNGVAGLEIRGSSGLFAAVSDIFIPVAQGAVEYDVTVQCSGISYPDPGPGRTVDGKFKIMLDVDGEAQCEIIVNGSLADDPVTVIEGRETEVKVDVSSGTPVIVDSFDGGSEDGTELEIKVGDGQSSDDIASADDGDSDSASEDGVSEDNDSVSEDGVSEDNDSVSEDGVSEDNDSVSEDGVS